MPKRSFSSVAEFESCVEEAESLIFDGTECLVERPKGYDNQKAKYSGKKHAHTDIALILSDKKRRIYYVSPWYDGSHVDMGILKREFPPERNWFGKHRLLFDLGFVGVDKCYTPKELVIGERKPRKSKRNPHPSLTEEQKQKNQTVSRERIFVEHAIGRIKKFRILKNKIRMKSAEMRSKVLGICAGLANYALDIDT